MKTLLTVATILFFLITYQSLAAQQYVGKRQPVFRSSADRIPAAITELEKAFTAKPGTEITFKFRESQFHGTVVSSVKRYENLYSAIIKNMADNTLMSFSKRINDDKTITYTGRILNDKSTDGYELVKAADGTYTFHKIQTEDLIQDQ